MIISQLFILVASNYTTKLESEVNKFEDSFQIMFFFDFHVLQAKYCAGSDIAHAVTNIT